MYTKARFNVVICKAAICTFHTSLLLRAINLTLLLKIHLWGLLKKKGVAETAGKFAKGVLVGVELPEGFVEFAEKVGVGIVQVAAEESWVG